MKKIISIASALLLTLGFVFFSGCQESDQLEDAKAVYITIDPLDVSLSACDTLEMRAYVHNLSGDTIRTPLEWLSDNEDIVFFDGNKLIAKKDAQNKSTKIRVRLKNGKYALTNVTVVRRTSIGINPVVAVKQSYSRENDTLWFAVSPKEVLIDYVPVVKNPNQELVIPASEDTIAIDLENGRFGYVFNAPRSSGEVTLTGMIGPTGSESQAEAKIVITPSIIPTLGDDFNSITYELSKTMDINKMDTVWVNTKVDPTYEIDLNNASQRYNWSVDGNAAQLFKTGELVLKDVGHRAYAVLRSGNFSGQTKVVFECNGTKLTNTVDVQDYIHQYPVDTLRVDKENIEMAYNQTVYITPTVKPISSFGFHVPKFESMDESIVKITGYTDKGSEMAIKGVGKGKTQIKVTSNDKVLYIDVEVVLQVSSILLDTKGNNKMFVGQQLQWTADVKVNGDFDVPAFWASEDETIASVDANGLITGIKGGKTRVYAWLDDVKSEYGTVDVIPVEDTYLDENNASGDAFAQGTDIHIILQMYDDSNPYLGSAIRINTGKISDEVVNGTYDVSAGNTMKFEIGDLENPDISLDITAGSLTITNDPDDKYAKRVSGTITISTGTGSFRMTIQNMAIYL